MSKSEVPHKQLHWFYRLLPPAVLSLITVIVYYPSLHYDFQFDDIANIQKNYFIRHHQLSKLIKTSSRWMSYWLNSLYYSIGKFDPFSYRVGNLMIHTINGVLVFYVILFALLHSKGQHFFKRNATTIAALTSMLFLLHPVQTQTVSYVIQGQLEGLACMFILSMILTFMHCCYTKSRTKQMLLGLLLFLLAGISCGTKEIAFMAPFLVMLIDWFFVAHGSFASFKKRLPLHGLLCAMVTGIYIYYLKLSFFTNILGFKMAVNNNIGNIITEAPQQTIGPWQFFISQFKVILHYIWMFIWPFNISVEYDWVLARGFFAWDCMLPLLALIAIGLIICRVLLTKQTHALCFGAIWFFVCIAPRSSIIPSPELLVDYKTYMASIGWLLIIACALVKCIESLVQFISEKKYVMKKQHAQLLCVSLLAIPLSLATWQRNLIWSSGTEFWMNVIVNAPGKARAYNNYGVEISQTHKRYEEAIPYFKKAAQMDHHYPDPLNNLAVCYSHLEQLDNAIDALKTGLKINPYYPEGYNNLASFYLRKKEYDKVERCLKTALQLRPHYGKAYFNLGRMHAEQGNDARALECFKNACTIADLDNEFGYKTYGQAAFNQKLYQEALWAFNKALECNPSDLDTIFTMANCFYLAKQYDQAINTYKHILAHKPDDLRSWFNLGEAHLAQENITQAFECFKHVEPQWQQLPQVRIRLAHCYEKMNNAEQAKAELNSLINTARAPAQLRMQAKEVLVQLEQHYPHLKAEALLA